ncbi:MAG: dimethylsulfoniopropionate demethylase [Rhodobacteraceae bacterium]|nr:dimethylsulfoniopropionate demethylase [Paracoccaceae bacterium]
MPHFITPSLRTRRTPFSRWVEQKGVKAYTVYNHMLLPTLFESLEEDCAHLKRAVQVWDVSAQRQVELKGCHAERLLQMTTPRNLARMRDDQCCYVPMVSPDGYMLNDPVVIRLAPDRFRVSLADSDMLFYFKGLVAGFGLDVAVFEPDVSPLAIQGPLANDLAAKLWGDKVRDLRFFRHMKVDVGGKGMLLARSGWSKQGGFELYLDGAEYAEDLWKRLFEAGEGMDLRAGCPNGIERIESGLLSFGNDMTLSDTPQQAGLGRYVQDVPGCLANDALKAMARPMRIIRAVEIAAHDIPGCVSPWPLWMQGKRVGEIRSAAYSPEFEIGVAIAMIDAPAWSPGTLLQVEGPGDEWLEATVRPGFWR